jgi:hypothetical protein
MNGWMIQSLQEVAARLRLPEGGAPWADRWDEAMRAAPAEPPAFLRPAAIAEACAAASMDEAQTKAAVATGGRIEGDPALRTLLWYYHYSMFLAVPFVFEATWPPLDDALGADAGMFHMLVVLSGMEHARQIHRGRGIAADVVRMTMSDLAFCLQHEDYTREHGRLGISVRIMSWLCNHCRGSMYRLGRLQFGPSKFAGGLRAYRNLRDGTVVALSEAGIRYRADGQLDGAGGIEDGPRSWVSKLAATKAAVEGNPIHPAGHAVQTRLKLNADTWKCVLADGDPVLDIHIPAGEPMDYDACGVSFHWAKEFFARHYPEQPFAGFCCKSWLLDSQFDTLLPPTSNLVRFQREMYLFPIAGQTSWTVGTVFGLPGTSKTGVDVAKLPRKTSMQRAFAEHLQRGGHFRAGGCFLLMDDLNWGSQFYRRQKLSF